MLLMALSSLKEGLPNLALEAEGWSITKNSAITQGYLEYSPKVIGSELTPKGWQNPLWNHISG